MLAGLDEGRGGLSGTCIEPPIVSQEPGEPSSPGTGGRLAVEKRREKPQGVDEFTHCRSGWGVWRRGQEQLEPGHTALGEPGARDSEAGAASRFSIRQGVREIAIAFDR